MPPFDERCQFTLVVVVSRSLDSRLINFIQYLQKPLTYEKPRKYILGTEKFSFRTFGE